MTVSEESLSSAEECKPIHLEENVREPKILQKMMQHFSGIEITHVLSISTALELVQFKACFSCKFVKLVLNVLLSFFVQFTLQCSLIGKYSTVVHFIEFKVLLVTLIRPRTMIQNYV